MEEKKDESGLPDLDPMSVGQSQAEQKVSIKSKTNELLDIVRRFEVQMGREQESLIYAFLLDTGLKPEQVELVRQEIGENDVFGLRVYCQERGLSGQIAAKETELSLVMKLLHRALPKLIAHHRDTFPADEENPETQDSKEYSCELIADIETSLGIKLFGAGGAS